MHRTLVYFIAVLTLVVASLAPAFAARRVALVIGNSAYESVPKLANPTSDSTAVAEGLKRLGFTMVEHRPDLDYRNFRRVLSDFSRLADGADIALIYYAGHGIEINKRNYLIPVDARLRDARDADLEALPLDVVLNTLEGARQLRLVILDACRNNPFRARMLRRGGTRSVGRGLARIDAPSNTLVAYAAKEGTTADDGTGDHSPYTTALLKHLETPGLEINFLFRRVRDTVLNATGGRQEPFVYGSLSSEKIFLKQGLVARTPPVPGLDTLAVELAFWQAAKDAGTPQGYEVYLRKYPKGNFAPLVAIKLEELAQIEAAEAKQRAELEAAKKKQAEADKAKRKAEAKQRAVHEEAAKKQAEAEAAKRKADADRRQRELAELENKQAKERERQAKEREELALRLKTIEEQVKARAEAVKHKEQKLAALQPPELQPKPDATATPLLDPRTMTLVLQNELKRVGCEPGKVDGMWGRKGRAALASFNKYAKLKLPTTEPSLQAIDAVKSNKQRICPVVCGAQYRIQGDNCVKKTCSSGQQLNSRGQCVKVVAKKPSGKPKPPATTKKKSRVGQPCTNPGPAHGSSHFHVYDASGDCVNS